MFSVDAAYAYFEHCYNTLDSSTVILASKPSTSAPVLHRRLSKALGCTEKPKPKKSSQRKQRDRENDLMFKAFSAEPVSLAKGTLPKGVDYAIIATKECALLLIPQSVAQEARVRRYCELLQHLLDTQAKAKLQTRLTDALNGFMGCEDRPGISELLERILPGRLDGHTQRGRVELTYLKEVLELVRKNCFHVIHVCTTLEQLREQSGMVLVREGALMYLLEK
jgi:hypothetical protein